MANHSVTIPFLSSYCNIWVKCCHFKLQFLLPTCCCRCCCCFFYSPFTCCFAVTTIAKYPFLLSAPSILSVCECTSAYVLLPCMLCVCVQWLRDNAYNAIHNVNLANIKSVVITDYVVHIAWSCLGWQSWLDTWKNRKKYRTSYSHPKSIRHTKVNNNHGEKEEDGKKGI